MFFRNRPPGVGCECVERVLLDQDLAVAALRQLSQRIRRPLRFRIRQANHEAPGIQAVDHDSQARGGVGYLPQSVNDIAALRLQDKAIR